MKTYKTFGLVAAAWAAIMCAMPRSASAAPEGDIWSIRRAAGGDHGTETLSMAENPLTAGQTVKFKFRLLNRDPQANFVEHGGKAGTNWDNRWYFKYVGAGGTNEAAAAASLYPPKIGVWVSGRYQWADVESLALVKYDDGTINYDFTDLICSYTVQPGDFGLLTLAAGPDSNPVEAAADGTGASAYCLKNSAFWGIYDNLTTTNSCNLWLTSQAEGSVRDYVTFPSDDVPRWVQDRDLSQAGIYIRTVDFDSSTFNDGTWRRIAAGGTSAYVNNGNAKRAPTLSIPGGVATDHTVTLYAWTEDETVAYMKNGVEYDFGGGVTRHVVHIPIAPEDGETKEIPGGIFAKGDAEGRTTTLYLSATPTNIFRSGVMITNFVTRTVAVGPQEPPSIVVTINDQADWTAVAGPVSEYDPIVPITVGYEGVESYARDLDVTVSAAMIDSTADVTDFVGLSATASPNPASYGTTVTVKIPAGRPSAFVYAYVKRANSDTADSAKGISLTPSITDTTAQTDFSGGLHAGILHIQAAKPVITSPATDTLYPEVPAGEAYEMSFNVSDAYGELSGKYTLEYTLSGVWSSMNTKSLDIGKPTGSDNTLTTNLIFNTTTSNLLVRVKNQDGHVSDPIHLIVEVFAKPLIGAVPVDHQGADGNPSRVYTESDEYAKLKYTLATPFSLADQGYIFLVPLTEASSNLVETTAFEQGVRIERGRSETERNATLRLLDGSAAGTELLYEFEIWNKPTKTEAGAVQLGTGTDGYASGQLSLYVENVAPTVQGVSMSDTPLFTNGGTMEAKAAKDVTKTFRLESVDEPSDIDLDSTDKEFMTEWKFYEGGAVLLTTNVYGNPYTDAAAVQYAFHNSGTNKVTVKVRDKDMSDQEFKLAPAFTFFVETLDEPTISMLPYHGSFYFTEQNVGSWDGRVDVKLNIAPTETIVVKIDVERDGPSDGLTSDPVLNTNLLTFTSGTTSRYFYFKELDGGSSYTVKASVITDTQSADPNKTWAQYYRLEEDGGYPMAVDNVAPVIQGVASTNPVPASIGVPTKPIQWSAKDVVPDVRKGMIASWTVEGGTIDVPITSTNTAQGLVGGSYSPTFTSSGHKTVTLTVTDKNGLSDTRNYYFVIEASKELFLYPLGPSHRGAGSLFSNSYLSAAGLGAGRVWADGGTPTISGFAQKSTLSSSLDSVNVYGYGYRVGDQATGNLMPGKDYKLTPGGDMTSGSSVYVYTDDLYDSFFYCWILNKKEENGNYTGEILGTIQPTTGTNSTDTARHPVGLPEYDKEAVQYEQRHVEAVFSKEYLPDDNVGDINQDGIPDIYAASVAWEGYGASSDGQGGAVATAGGGNRLFEIAGYAGVSAGDLKRIASYNGDNDFLPSKTSAGGNLIPNIASGWATYGEPFTAILELRGYGSGLNFRESTRKGQGRNSAGTWISGRSWVNPPSALDREQRDLLYREAESNAWATVYASDPDWTPENRTDPTIDDTDEDGMPDGYEYYIWYHAYVGWMEDGKYKRLEGSRFQLDDIAVGTKITPDEIAEAFNPNIYAVNMSERDTDMDGLTDLEEFAIGSNPVHWDTDGDGCSDYWEVLRGLNPLVVEKDGATNPDGDYMAWADVGKEYAVLKLPDGRMFAVAGNGGVLVKKDDDGKYFVNESATNNVAAIEVYRYGAAGSSVIPVNRGEWGAQSGVAICGSSQQTYSEYVCSVKPLDTAPIDWGEDIEISNVTVTVGQTLSLIHEQVRAQYGFDPRTAWHRNVNGRVCDRWDPNLNSKGRFIGSDSTTAVNTKAYSNLDEYLLLKYRYKTKGGANDLARDFAKDKADWRAKTSALGGIFKGGTTNPNVPYSGKTYGDLGKSASGADGGSQTTFADKTHGADSDSDGVPDGWELYVGYDPGVKKDGIVDSDGDGLTLASEYAGTDSCTAYKSATTSEEGTETSDDTGTGGEGEVTSATIYNNHPGIKKGWYNKFWPTDPWNGDTDGDCIRDDTEGGSWKDATVFNNAVSYSTENGDSYTYTFIYGSPEDDGSLCIRGGGMNPCSVDTDFDNLPDPWEMSYAGIRAAGGVLQDASFRPETVTLCRRNDGLDSTSTNASSSASGVYITAGMDATFGYRPYIPFFTGDSYTNPNFKDPRTGTVRNYDFDQDGLQNFQEYLTQGLRHLRYDDSETPLMGSWMPDGSPDSRKFLGFLQMNILDGEKFYAAAKEKGFVATGAWQFRELGYFARPPREWDPIALLPRSNSSYDEKGYRMMFPPHGLSSNGGRMAPFGYACTDPRTWDTDMDNMGDFYELFHGLNPLLGSVANIVPGEMPNASYDVISRAYGGAISFWGNAWTGWPMEPQDWLSDAEAYRDIDAIKYPWMIGSPEADPDGDGIRNIEEAIVVNMTSPQPTHTDPTPLWLTDSTAPNFASYTSQYYQRDPELEDYGWAWSALGQTGVGATPGYLFSFEENEGYDTDGDWISDSDEQHLTATPTSDPQKFSDPSRRQPIWFPGENSAVISYSSQFHPLNYGAYDFLRQFTVEAWIKPEDVSRDQVVIERVAAYGASNISNSLARVRANFRIGIREDGRLYGLFDTSDAVTSGAGDGTSYVLGNSLTPGKWVHVALAFNGKSLNLFMDGVLVNSQATTLIPANGIINLIEDAIPNMSNFPVLRDGYDTLPIAIVLGAKVLDVNGISLSDKSTWDSYGSFYSGYIDEVRVWDGARTLNDISAEMRRRYGFDDMLALRERFFALWDNGYTRNDNDGKPTLPAELVAYYDFQALPGATEAQYVAWEPSGFTKNVRNLGKVEGNNVPGDIWCGWWYSTPVRSTVYRNWRIVPWIHNMIGHLPIMDGSTIDSQFWSEYYGGMTPATELGVDKIVFPNTANPYPRYIYTTERRYHEFKLNQMVKQDILSSEVARRYQFELNHNIVTTSDLLPLGGAFAKRCDEMWDGNGPADAWSLTLRDMNANGIPDWWEKVAIANYGAPAGFDLETIVTFDGREMTAREAYLRDLARGMTPTGASNGAVDETLKDIADADFDGMPDWWEDLYGIRSQSGIDDADSDQLSNYAEWLISECFSKYGFPRVNPLRAYSFADDQGQVVPDYFLKVGRPYLGDMFADHDLMEDIWEDQFDPDLVSRFRFDAWTDPDDDGWSNWAECRFATDPSRMARLGVDEMLQLEYPTPSIKTTVFYNGDIQFGPMVVQAWHMGDTSGRPDAVWKVGVSNAKEGQGQSSSSTTNSAAGSAKLIGMNPGKDVILTLGPGAVVPGTVTLMFKDVAYESVTAKLHWDPETESWDESRESVTSRTLGDAASAEWVYVSRDRARSGDNTKGDLVITTLSTIEDVVGTIDYTTGDVRIDFSKLQFDAEHDIVRSGDSSSRTYKLSHLANSYVQLVWTSRLPQQSFPVTFALSDPVSPTVVNSLGRLREGKNVFVAFLDRDNNGAWAPGEPYGVATDVDVGWSGASIAIEMTDVSPVMARINIFDAVSGGDDVSDRGYFGNGATPNVTMPYEGTNMPAQTYNDVRVRLAVQAVNGWPCSASKVYPNGVFFDERFNLGAGCILSEKDLLAAGDLDLGWGALAAQATRLGFANQTLSNMTFRVVLGEGDIASNVTNNSLTVAFVNRYELGTAQTQAVPVSPAGAIYTRPTFRWTHTNSVDKAYPAFRLRVWNAATGTAVANLIYDSGNLPAPPRHVNAAGEYEYAWTAPIYPDMLTPNGKVFATTNNYWWSVSMLDAKFSTPNSTEKRQEFRLEASGLLGQISDYGMVKAKVRYSGPGIVSAAAQLKNIIRVQAFTSPDFTGEPAGEARVTSLAGIADSTNIAPNAVILALRPGTYYLRAFIDTNGDAKWSRWESWGYGNYVGAWDAVLIKVNRGILADSAEATSFPFTPRPYTVAAGAEPPVAEIYIEDMDTDADHLPDIYEMDTEGSLSKRSAPKGATFFTRVNTNLEATVSSYTRLNEASAGTTYAPMRLMGAMLSGSDPYAMAAAIDMLSDGAVTENVAVRIASFSLEGGLELSITADVTADESNLSLFTVADSAKVKVILVAAKSPDFADAREVAIKTITINANATTGETVTAEELGAAIDAAGLDDAAFFKVRLEEAE